MIQIQIKFLTSFLLINNLILAQDLGIYRTKEEILSYSLDSIEVDRYSYYFIGSDSNDIIYYYENLIDRTEKLLTIKGDEHLDVSTKYKFALQDAIIEDNTYISTRSILNESFFYCKDRFEDPSDYGSSKLYINNSNVEYYLDSIYNADKKIHSSFSSDGQYLLVNSLNTLSDYYNPEQDNRIMVYDLSEIEQGKIEKEYIPCTHCSDSYLVGDQLFFTIGRKDGYGGFSNKDIYVAPWGNIQDTVKIADNTDILAISPDGKYILGSRFWDRQQNTAVIVDVENKKYQMLLGRDYAKKKAFYSEYANKFTFDFKGYLIYVDLPENYPFDALKWRNEEIPDWTDEEFWKQYQHPPLPKR